MEYHKVYFNNNSGHMQSCIIMYFVTLVKTLCGFRGLLAQAQYQTVVIVILVLYFYCIIIYYVPYYNFSDLSENSTWDPFPKSAFVCYLGAACRWVHFPRHSSDDVCVPFSSWTQQAFQPPLTHFVPLSLDIKYFHTLCIHIPTFNPLMSL